MHRPLVSVIAGLVSAMVLVAGCASEGTDLAVLSESPDAAMEAGISGELRIDADDCVRIGDWFTVWPKDARRTRHGVEVDGQPFLVGDAVNGSGGYFDQERAKGMVSPRTAPEFERCAAQDDEVAVLQLIV